MSAILPKGEKLRNAVKWISYELKSNKEAKPALLIQEAASKFNLSPKEETFLMEFYNKK
jgi:hypothetical protein